MGNGCYPAVSYDSCGNVAEFKKLISCVLWLKAHENGLGRAVTYMDMSKVALLSRRPALKVSGFRKK